MSESKNQQIQSESLPLSYGQKAVGISFNPGGMPEVNKIKELSAALIDELYKQLEDSGAKGLINFDMIKGLLCKFNDKMQYYW